MSPVTVNSRASGFRNILTCFSQIYECQDPSTANGVPTLRSSVGALESFLDNEPALNARTKDHLRHVFTMFNDLVEEDVQTFRDNGYRRVKTFAPIELVAVAVLISQHGLSRPRGMLLGDIRALREHLRSTNIDLRMNKSVWSHAWDFVDDLEGQRGTVDGSTLPRRAAKPQQPKKATIKTTAAVVPRATATDQPSAPTTTPKNSSRVTVLSTKGTPTALSSPQTQKIRPAANGTQPVPARPTEASRLAAYTARIQQEDTQRAALPSRDDVANARVSRSTSSSSSSVASAADSLLDPPPAPEVPPPLKRRANLDLGTGSTGARALVAKKAKMIEK